MVPRHLQKALQFFFRVSFEARDLSDHWRHRHGQVGVVSLLGDGAQVCWLDPNFPSVFGTFLGVFSAISIFRHKH